MPDKDIPTPPSRPAEPATAGGTGPVPGSTTAASTTPAADSDGQAAIEQLALRVAELEDLWRRALADLDNMRKRAARDVEQQRTQERARVAAAWLPVVDNLELALAHSGASPSAIVDGVRAVLDQALAVLRGLGYPRRDDVGTTFDPARHEAVATRSDPHAAPGTVVQVLRAGYGEGDHQLRPASVVVAAGKDNGRHTEAEASGGGGGDDRRNAGAQ
jgi:molecular chaperone GrpE